MKRFLLSMLALLAIASGSNAQDMLSTPLTLEAVEAGTINILNPNALTIEYSKDGTSWTAANSNPISIAVATGDQVRLRGNNPAYCLIQALGSEVYPGEHPTNITATNDVYVYGNVMSLINSTDFATLTTLPKVGGDEVYDSDNNFAYLFTTPEDENTIFPKINTTIRNHPTKDIVLPAKNVTRGGYMYMFSHCQGITRAPKLPATDLGWGCYHQMFSSTSIERAPVLPAAAPPDNAYSAMFWGCTKLNYVKCLATDLSGPYCTDGWLTGVAATGTFVKADGMTAWTIGGTGEWNEVNGIPDNWTIKNVSEEAGEYVAAETPLTLEATEDGTTITINNPLALTIQYSTDGGTNWTSASDATITISGINAGKTVQLRGDNAAYSTEVSKSNSTNISFDKDCYVYGNIMSLISSTGYSTLTTLTGNYAFCMLFSGNSHLKNHATKDLVLPATTLTDYCYASMFSSCSGLTKAFVLPATALVTKCYRFMFSGCTALASAPELPATTMAEECYNAMFQNTALTIAPALPATTLAKGCYMNMFRNCTKLTTAPALPATTMAESCYEYMFHSAALTAAPVLPATTLADRCYFGMFLNCASLITPPALPATTLAKNCYGGMFYGCGLTSIPALPATEVPDMAYSQMFEGCNSLTTVPVLTATTVGYLGYRWMFQNCTGLTASPAIQATTLGESACYKMFLGCTNLVTAGDLSATTLGNGCCDNMFTGCTSLTKAPALPATTLSTQCYQRMFDGCTSLVDAPALPATTLADLCYNDMFWNCTALKNAPVLPATILVDYCYTMMFYGCSSLEKAPDLPATTLKSGCYEHMFMNCSSLNYVKCLATDLGDASTTDGWMTNVAATGTFVKAPDADWSGRVPTEGTWGDPGAEVPITFVHGIPSGWTVDQNSTSFFDVTIKATGQATLYCDKNLDFTDVEGLKAYVVMGNDKKTGTIWLSRVKRVAAGTPLLLRGTAGDYDIPLSAVAADSYYKNMLKGAATEVTINRTDGVYTNYYSGSGTHGVGFYAVSDAGMTIGAGKAYLPLPTSITQVGTAGSTVQITIGEKGQTTYCSANSLDFSSVADKDVKAFVVTGYDKSDGTIWLSRINEVPAGTGILIRGPQGTYDVKTVSSQSYFENMLKGTLSATTIGKTDGEFTNYYLSLSGTHGPGFYRVTEDELTVGAGKAYLQIPSSLTMTTRAVDAAEPDAFNLKFDEDPESVISLKVYSLGGINGEDGTTGVNEVISEEVMSNQWYDLQGRRIDCPQKPGLYILNGKKVVVR